MVEELYVTYPQVRVSVHYNGGDKSNYITMTTRLRVNKNGIWYLWPFYRSVSVGSDEGVGLRYIEELNRFHGEVYRTLIAGKVDTGMVHLNGIKFFEVDDDQRDEKKRLGFE